MAPLPKNLKKIGKILELTSTLSTADLEYMVSIMREAIEEGRLSGGKKALGDTAEQFSTGKV